MILRNTFLGVLSCLLLPAVVQAQQTNEWVRINLQSGEEETVYVDGDCDEECELPAIEPVEEENETDVWLDENSLYNQGGFQTLDLSLEESAYPDQNFHRTAIVGHDNRIDITRRAKGATKAAVTLEVQISPRTWGMCSGAMVGPRLVLTAAHCLYVNGHPAQSVVVVASGLKNQPVAYADDIWFPEEFKKDDSYDLGLILLDRRLGNQTGILGLKAMREGNYDNLKTLVVGRGGDKPMRSLWKSYGYIRFISGGLIFTNAPIVKGNSGGPLIVGGGKIAGILTQEIPSITWEDFSSHPIESVVTGIYNFLGGFSFYPNIALAINSSIIDAVKSVNRDIAKQERQWKQKKSSKKKSQKRKKNYRA